MNRLSGDTLLKSCDPVESIDEATRPILSPLLPVKGLRRDADGKLTEDAYKTVMDGIRSLGIQTTTADSQTAILQEARFLLCRLFAQYEFLLNAFTTAIARSERVNSQLMATLNERVMQMMDVITIARRVIDEGGSNTTMEGFQERRVEREQAREAFTNAEETIRKYKERLQTTNKQTLYQRVLQDSTERNVFASRQLGLYSFLNIVAAGLLFYILTT